jgi:hypothetical protein
MSAPAPASPASPASFPVCPALPVVAVCRRNRFAACEPYHQRIVEAHDTTTTFWRLSDVPIAKRRENPILNRLCELPESPYLAMYHGIPGLVLGVSPNANDGVQVFTNDMKHSVELDDSKKKDNKIKFLYGRNEILEARDYCWEFAVKAVKIDVVREVEKTSCVSYPLRLTREDETKCPICFDELTGNVVCCSSAHQTCLSCYNLMAGERGTKRCPTCRSSYNDIELEKIDQMNGAEFEGLPYFRIKASGAGNSHTDFTFAEFLFMGMIKSAIRLNHIDTITTMLMSGFYNYAYRQIGGEKDRSITDCVSGNDRAFYPFKMLDNDIVNDFIDIIDTPEIYNDIGHTGDFYMNNSTYPRREFNNDLDAIVGAENYGVILKRYETDEEEKVLRRIVYFRTRMRRMSKDDIKSIIETFFKHVINKSKTSPHRFNQIRIVS